MIRRLALSAAALGLAATAVVLAPASPAQAIPACLANNYCVKTYYSDSTYTRAVGGVANDYCVSPSVHTEWGTTSSYPRVTNTPC